MARTMLTIAMEPELHKRLQATAGEMGKRELSKLACALIDEGLARRGLLVVYENDEQRETGEPLIVAEGTARVWSDTAWLKGWADPEGLGRDLAALCARLEEKAGAGKRAANYAAWIADSLKKNGWTAQVVNDRQADILEVWAHKPGDRCAECPKMARIMDAINAED